MGMFTLGDAVSVVAKTAVTTESVSETAKDTFQKIQAGTAFINPHGTKLTSATVDIQIVSANLATWAGSNPSDYATLTSQLTDVANPHYSADFASSGVSLQTFLATTMKDKLGDFKAAGDVMTGVSTTAPVFATGDFSGFAEIPTLNTIARTALAKKGLNQAMASAGMFDADNPCLPLEDMLGPFLPGNPIGALLDGVISALASLIAAGVGFLISTLASLFGPILNGIAGMIAGLIGALGNIFSALEDLLNINLAASLEGLFMDPCMNYMLRKSGMITSPVLQNLINSVGNQLKPHPGVGVWVNPNGSTITT